MPIATATPRPRRSAVRRSSSSAADDAMTPARSGRALAAKIAGARVVELPRIGHFVMAEAPDAMLDALDGFLPRSIMKRFANFSEFYPFYLTEHANVVSRRLHFAGTSGVIACVVAGVVDRPRVVVPRGALLRLRLRVDRALLLRAQPPRDLPSSGLQPDRRLGDVRRHLARQGQALTLHARSASRIGIAPRASTAASVQPSCANASASVTSASSRR